MERRDFLKGSVGVTGAGLLLANAPILKAFAQSETPRRGGTLIWGHSETTQNIDIHQTGTASTLRLLQNVHDSVLTVDSDFNLQPSLAESFEESADGLTYTFRLRPNVRFHNGKPVTSADVKYSFERVKNPDTGAVNFEVFNDVAEILTPDELTVVVKMSGVNAPFLGRLAELGAGVVLPEGSGDTQGTQPIGAGPFKFISREFGNEVRLERFDDYWQEPAYVDKIISREVTEPIVRLTGLQTGEMHIINDLPLDRVNQLKKDDDLQISTWFPLSWAFLNFNHKRAPYNDRRVRLAFDHMIDKKVLVQGALWGQGEVTASPSFPNSSSRNGSLEARPQVFDKARSLLKEAGFGPGELEFVFKVTTNYPWHIDAAQILQEWFREGGLKVEVQQLTWSDWLSQCWIDRDYDVTMMNFFTLWEPDFLYYSLWHSTGAFNYRNVNDPTLDGLAEQARVTVDKAARNEIYHKIQQRIHDESLDVVLWYRNGTLGARNNVGGLDKLVHPNGSNLNFRHLWLKA